MALTLQMTLGPAHEMGGPEYDEDKLASLIDVLARASAKPLGQHGDNLELLKEIQEAGITYRQKGRLYFFGDDKLAEIYFIKLRYMCAKAGSRKVDIKLLTAADRSTIDDIVSDFGSEVGEEFDIEWKTVTRARMRYKSIKTSEGKEVARVFQSKLSFVHDRLKHDSATYEIGVKLVARLAAEMHRQDLFRSAKTISYSDYMGPMYVKIPGWFRKNYLADVVKGFNAFLESKNTQQKIPNPVEEGEVSAGDMVKEAKKKPGCYYAADKYKKRHIDYIFADENGKIVVKLDCNVDLQAIQKRTRQPLEILVSGRWVDEREVEPNILSIVLTESSRKGNATEVTRRMPGNYLLQGTKFSDLRIYLRKSAIYTEGRDKPLVRFGQRTVILSPRSEYDDTEYELAVEAANAVYEQMLYSTQSTITRKGTTARLHNDEVEVVMKVDALARSYMEDPSRKYTLEDAKRRACRDIVADAKKRLKTEILAKYGLEGRGE